MQEPGSGCSLFHSRRRMRSLPGPSPQSTAKQTYSVSDADLAKLGSLRKANPHKADWTPMQLFLESQVRGPAAAQRQWRALRRWILAR